MTTNQPKNYNIFNINGKTINFILLNFTHYFDLSNLYEIFKINKELSNGNLQITQIFFFFLIAEK